MIGLQSEFDSILFNEKTITRRQQAILEIIAGHSPASTSRIQEQLPETVSIPTLNRDLAN